MPKKKRTSRPQPFQCGSVSSKCPQGCFPGTNTERILAASPLAAAHKYPHLRPYACIHE